MVIAQNTEATLLNDLKECWETQPTHRCLHLKLSLLHDDTQGWLSLMLHEFRTYFDDVFGQVYVCHDEDIFILTRSLTQKRVDEIVVRLASKLSKDFLSEGITALYEIGVDFARLRTICEKKLETIKFLKDQRSIKKKDELEGVSKTQAVTKIDPALVQTIGQRRDSRDDPEILVVEDDVFSQKMVQNSLKSKYTTSVVGDGAGALMTYANKAPDVLFLDIGLPDMDGHAVLERLFKMDPNAYVVMFSGNGDKENIMRAVELGAKGFVGKPFTQDKLIQYIEKSPFIQKKKS